MKRLVLFLYLVGTAVSPGALMDINGLNCIFRGEREFGTLLFTHFWFSLLSVSRHRE